VTRPKRREAVPGAIFDARARQQLELEVVSTEARLRLTRLLRKAARGTGSGDPQIELIRANKIINLANAVLARPIYTLDLSEDYEPAEYAWHNGELELAMRRPDSPQLFEILVDLVDEQALSKADINAILEADGCSVRIDDGDDGAQIELIPLADLPEEPSDHSEHPNVRKLIERMDRAMQDRDWSLVLHTAASVFETIAKQVVPNPNVQNRSLGSWFSLYRNHSKLAVPLLDTIESIFTRRNIEPLAGHGSVSNPSITEDEAIQVRELTIALVRLEHALGSLSLIKVAKPKRKKRRNKCCSFGSSRLLRTEPSLARLVSLCRCSCSYTVAPRKL
jgi:hypothetical protein